MAGATTRFAIEAFLRSLLQGPGRPAWDDWLPIAGVAIANPGDWITAVQSLGEQEQYTLLESLRDDAGPFADALLLLTARHAQDIEDPQVRDFLLSDALDSSDRRTSLMAEQRTSMQQLVGQMEARHSKQFDIAEEVGKLERRVNELRAAEIDTEFERVHVLEREIMRLETFQRSLTSYDVAAREAHREELDRETGILREQRTRAEKEVANAIAERDEAQRGAVESNQQLVGLQEELEALRAETASSTQTIAGTTIEVHGLRREKNERKQELAVLERERAELDRQIAEDADRIKELRDSPTAQAAEELANKVREVFDLLQPDLAEREFTNQAPRKAIQ